MEDRVSPRVERIRRASDACKAKRSPPAMGSASFRKRRPRHDAAALFDSDDLVRRNVLKHFRPAAGPLDFEPLPERRRAKPEVSPQIVLTEVARARFHVSHLRAGS